MAAGSRFEVRGSRFYVSAICWTRSMHRSPMGQSDFSFACVTGSNSMLPLKGCKDARRKVLARDALAYFALEIAAVGL